MSNDALLALQDVSYRVGRRDLLEGLNLEIEAGSFTIVLGPNGSGKTLLLQLCHGLIQPTRGAPLWNNGSALPPCQTMVFQKPVLLRRTALENISYVLRDIPRAERVTEAANALRWAGLEYLADRPALVLSSGEQQQLALARAHALKPTVLFLDEPTANLDPNASVRIEGLIRAIHESGTTVMMTTHNLAQAQRLGDNIAFLNEGRIESHQANKAFFETPQSPLAASFIQSEVISLQ